jgi:hypothetical protein
MGPGASDFRRVPGIAGTVRVLRQMPDGRLWIGTIGQGAYAHAHGALARIAPHAGTAAAGNTIAYTVAVSSDVAMHWPASNVVPESQPKPHWPHRLSG